MKTTTSIQKTFEKYDGKHFILYFNEAQKEVPAQDPGSDEQQPQLAYEYDTVIVECTEPGIAAFTQALQQEGYTEDDAAIIATEAMLQAVRRGEQEGDQKALAHSLEELLITRYDKSTAVNQFTYRGVPMWLDKETRNGLLIRLNAEDNAGKRKTTLWLGTQSFELGIEEGIQLLYALEVYASECFDVTAAHKAAAAALDDPDEILAYDFTAGYPPQLDIPEQQGE